ncbi:sulfatase-like hydrolase/transferase [Lentisphaera marina]|uniref:sulfatase family protein n=1 Tax=Lentisphaera marina TaxID=1111041 RepID=UPI002365EF22|nr:sulfatase-like hydrolase/transferase [Lentisphaera marina]MDD7985256.1 sulfatase-like hydrolase/transferase [Lentisphaera marina]
MKKLSLIIITLFFLGFTIQAVDLKAPKNFIVIFADDFGYGDLGCYRELFQGKDDLTISHKFTPNLDKLGRNGVRFMQTYTPSWCAPARTNLLSGRWCNRADILEKPWIGKQLRDRGYTTAFVGKSHGTGSIGLNADPASAGFNDALVFNGGMRKFYMRKGEQLPRRTDFQEAPFVAEGGEYITDLFTDFGADFIKRSAQNKKPFLLYLAYTAPHTPLDGKLEDLQAMFPKEFEGIENSDWLEFMNGTKGRGHHQVPDSKLKGFKKRSPGWTKENSLAYQKMSQLGTKKFNDYNYAALVYSMDRGIGKIMQTLKEAGVEDDTLVIFTCDNGSISGTNYPLQNFKSSHFEGGIRVPMIFWSKAMANSEGSGRIVDEITPTSCIAPTLVGIVDQKEKPNFPFDGINLWPYLAKNNPIPDDQSFFYSSSNSSFYKAAGLYRDMSYGELNSAKKKFSQARFCDLKYWDRDEILNTVYIKGKDKIVFWSSKDGKTQGATYRKLPTKARLSENPQAFFKEEYVQQGQFPTGANGAAFMDDFIKLIAADSKDELREIPIFNSANAKNSKAVHDYLKK